MNLQLERLPSIDVLDTTNISVDSEWEDKNHDGHDFNVGGDVFDDDEGVDRSQIEIKQL